MVFCSEVIRPRSTTSNGALGSPSMAIMLPRGRIDSRDEGDDDDGHALLLPPLLLTFMGGATWRNMPILGRKDMLAITSSRDGDPLPC